MSKKITEKIREILTPEDQKVLESAIESMVSERVAKEVAEKVALAEEELKTKYDILAEEYTAQEIAKGIEKGTAALVEEYDAKINDLEKKIVNKLDSFLEHVITEQISDETLNKIAMNEVLMPVVEGVKKVFHENHIELNSDGEKVVTESKNAVAELEKNLSESIAKNMELEERLEKTATFLLISEKTDGLTQSQKARVIKMFRDKSFDEVKEKIDTFIEMVKENVEKKIVTETKTIDSVTDVKSNITEEKKVVPDTESFDYDEVKVATENYL